MTGTVQRDAQGGCKFTSEAKKKKKKKCARPNAQEARTGTGEMLFCSADNDQRIGNYILLMLYTGSCFIS